MSQISITFDENARMFVFQRGETTRCVSVCTAASLVPHLRRDITSHGRWRPPVTFPAIGDMEFVSIAPHEGRVTIDLWDGAEQESELNAVDFKTTFLDPAVARGPHLGITRFTQDSVLALGDRAVTVPNEALAQALESVLAEVAEGDVFSIRVSSERGGEFVLGRLFPDGPITITVVGDEAGEQSTEIGFQELIETLFRVAAPDATALRAKFHEDRSATLVFIALEGASRQRMSRVQASQFVQQFALASLA